MKLICKILILFILPAAFIFGCRKNSDIPDPPRAESDIIVELFKSLNDNNYSLASQKIKKLRMINPDDFYLANIEYQIQIDSGFNSAQKLLDEGKVSDAYNSINNTIEKFGNQNQLTEAKSKLEILSEIDKLSKKVIKAKNSSNVAIPTGELNRIILANPFAAPLKSFTEYNLDRARLLMTAEEVMAKDDLKADIDIARIIDNNTAETMLAELAIEEAKDNWITAYELSLSRTWYTIKSNDNEIIKPDYELLYFRQALNSNKLISNNMFIKLLSVPPANFSGMLLRAFILNNSGYKNEAQALSQLISSTLQLNTSKTEGWFKFLPDQISDFYSINPFVLYPFFVYCESN